MGKEVKHEIDIIESDYALEDDKEESNAVERLMSQISANSVKNDKRNSMSSLLYCYWL